MGPRNHILGGAQIPPKEGTIWGTSAGPLRSIVNTRHELKLFARWQQRCGLSLSVLRQLVARQSDGTVWQPHAGIGATIL